MCRPVRRRRRWWPLVPLHVDSASMAERDAVQLLLGANPAACDWPSEQLTELLLLLLLMLMRLEWPLELALAKTCPW